MNNTKIPHTDSIQALAEFWDSHDSTDFADQLEEVTEPVFDHKTTLQIQLTPQTIAALQATAKQQGIRDVELVQAWILEKLRTV